MILLFLFPLLVSLPVQTDPEVSLGQLDIFHDFNSEYVTDRTVYVWLPESFDPELSYPVLYMHDGQMLFDSTTTWNQQEWGIDETVQRLIDMNEIPPLIVVGISNISAERHADYFPLKPFLLLNSSVRDSLLQLEQGDQPLFRNAPTSDNYLKFIISELKPFIDRQYPTVKTMEGTFIGGSSMGGLISMYAFFEYPDVFGGAACLSTHWIGGFEQNTVIPTAFQKYISARKSLIKGRKLYFDHGTETLDAYYSPHQKNVDEIFELVTDDVYLSLRYEGDAHDERSWKNRFEVPLTFLLNK